jgi:hypothetical protein
VRKTGESHPCSAVVEVMKQEIVTGQEDEQSAANHYKMLVIHIT